MNKVVLDPSTRSSLNGLDQSVEVCDESGKTLGYFVPADEYLALMYAWARAEFAGDDTSGAREEFRAEGGYTTAEVLAKIEEVVRQGKGQG